MFNTPNGIAIVDVAKIGTERRTARDRRARVREADISPGARARSTTTAAAAERVTAVNIDTRRTREVPHARGLINADETLSVVKNAQRGRSGRHASAPAGPRRSFRNCSGCFPARGWKISRPISSTRSTKEDGLAAPRAQSDAAVVRVHEPQDRRIARNRLPVRRPESPAVQSRRSEPSAVLPRRHVARAGSDVDHPHRRQPDAADAPAHDGHGDQRPRVVELGRQDGVVRSADAAQPGLLDRRREHGDGQEDPLSPPARLVGRALQQLARRHALRQRRRRSRRRSPTRPTGCGSISCACSRTGR